MSDDGSFFFSSRRRHTRCGRDWSSDVCSSDLAGSNAIQGAGAADGSRSSGSTSPVAPPRSEERRVGKGVDLGGRRIIKKKRKKKKKENVEGKRRKNSIDIRSSGR